MGNQLVGVAPSQIYPVEHYLSDHVDLTFDQRYVPTLNFNYPVTGYVIQPSDILAHLLQGVIGTI